LWHALLGNVTDEVVEPATVVEQSVALETQPGQVLEQQALLRGRLVQASMRRLPTAGTQHANGDWSKTTSMRDSNGLSRSPTADRSSQASEQMLITSRSNGCSSAFTAGNAVTRSRSLAKKRSSQLSSVALSAAAVVGSGSAGVLVTTPGAWPAPSDGKPPAANQASPSRLKVLRRSQWRRYR